MHILVVNPGSSSMKLAVVAQPGDALVAAEDLDRGADATRHVGGGEDLEAALQRLGVASIDAVGYRVVHGGAHQDAAVVDDGLVAEIDRLDALAPLHNAVGAAAIRDVRARLGGVPHVACFDTAFHATLPLAARTYAIPADWLERFGIRRYGFHGLSVRWAIERAAARLDRDAGDLHLVVAHLGSGASVTAVRNGASAATSMGMTPLEGLVMGTRSGSIDPGIVLHLLRQGVGIEALADGLSHGGGLAALSGGTAGMRELESSANAGDERARLAIDVFVARAAAEIGAAATALDRLDALVFTGGIGARSAAVREAICNRLGSLGVRASTMTGAADGRLAEGSAPAVLVVTAREEIIIARDVFRLLSGGRAAPAGARIDRGPARTL
jgi:acetate kinase